MNALNFVLLLSVVAAAPAKAPEVRGLIATRVTFADDARVKLGDAVLDLLASSAHSQEASEEGWLAAQRQCHLYLKFAKPPRTAAVHGADEIPVAEVVVTFPLPSTGGIWVCSGDRYAYFAKYSGPATSKIQELLGEAKSAD